MKNKIKILCIALPLVFALAGLMVSIITASTTAWSILAIGYGLAKFIGIVLWTQQTDFIKTIYFKLIAGCITLVFIGALFRLMHWPGSAVLLSFSTFAIAVIYALRFNNKDEKNRADLLKLIWVVLTYTLVGLLFMDLVPAVLVEMTDILLWINIVVFLVADYQLEQRNSTVQESHLGKD